MQTSKIIQAVILMLIVAMAASCAAGRQYSDKVFGPRTSKSTEPASRTVRFLGSDDEPDSLTLTLTKPLTTSDTALVVIPPNKTTNKADTLSPVVRSSNSGGVRTKRTRDDQ